MDGVAEVQLGGLEDGLVEEVLELEGELLQSGGRWVDGVELAGVDEVLDLGCTLYVLLFQLSRVPGGLLLAYQLCLVLQ